MKEWIAVLRAADAAARWHVHQRRKGAAVGRRQSVQLIGVTGQLGEDHIEIETGIGIAGGGLLGGGRTKERPVLGQHHLEGGTHEGGDIAAVGCVLDGRPGRRLRTAGEYRPLNTLSKSSPPRRERTQRPGRVLHGVAGRVEAALVAGLGDHERRPA